MTDAARPSRRARRLICLLVVALCLGGAGAWPAHAADETGADTVVVRVSSRPDREAVIGQRVHVFVDVLFQDAMPRPPRVTLPDVPGAQVFRFETQATSISDRIGGRDYSGQRFEFALYPRRGGRLAVLPATVTLLDHAGHETGTAQSAALDLSIAVPPGVDPSQAVVASTRMESDERWTPAPDTAFKVGDALTRTITREAEDVPGVAMRTFAFTAPDGVRVYADPPRLEDKVERGEVVGGRTDRVVYVFEKAGVYELPGVSQPWWDLEANRLRMASHPDVRVSVTAALPPPDEHPWSRLLAPKTIWMLAGGAGGLVTLIILALRSGRRVAAAWTARRQRPEALERAAFDTLQRACLGTDARIIYGAFLHWRACLSARLGAEAHADDSPSLSDTADLERILYGGEDFERTWTVERSRNLAVALRTLRRERLRNRPSLPSYTLPPLNPARPLASSRSTA